MPIATFSPKQIAFALGVSESSVKRWVDSGRLEASKTAGGHRKVLLPSVAQFVRETGHPVAHPEVIGLVASGFAKPLSAARDLLHEELVAGREEECRNLVLGFYQAGESIARLGDQLIGPVLRRIGDGWEAGTVAVYQERRACQVMMAILHEIRRWLDDTDDERPLAIVATPLQDFAEVPLRLVELTLISSGWRVMPAGSGLPLEEILAAAVAHRPGLLCVSVTHLESPGDFAEQLTAELIKPLRERSPETLVVIGGGAIESAGLCIANVVDQQLPSLHHLTEYLERLQGVA
ncbi:MerR family transcriptional regulator [Botrimarina hoheduenensis]|uniref:B12-binding domain-containing protein n=1 Tax=Botrimarina hoheduenensis TaxID=2528000 RepID=A0A5C5WG56_9BACT|nr:B12-binding domain-containing protein [Botrimarina hoheduenensis]TWT48762.1 hypothetical protein Pla111_05370 [Botrimarina hoheduenensis]